MSRCCYTSCLNEAEYELRNNKNELWSNLCEKHFKMYTKTEKREEILKYFFKCWVRFYLENNIISKINNQNIGVINEKRICENNIVL